jgi:group I intron endonuclease
MFVYKITNQVNGKVYIGITTGSIEKRWREHKCAANKGSQLPLYKAIRKYGHEAFSIEQLATADTVEDLKAQEVRFIKELGSFYTDGNGYNMTDGGDGVHFVNRARGEKSGRAVLTEEIVKFIRAPDLVDTNNTDMVDCVHQKFGMRFNVETIKSARNGKGWGHLNNDCAPIKTQKGGRKNPMSDALRSVAAETLGKFRDEALKKSADLRRGKRAAHAKMDYDTVRGVFYEPMSLVKTAEKYGISKKMVLLVRQQKVYTYWTKEFQNAVNI